MAKPRRHLGFFALMEALQQPGCPACRLADRAGRRFLETLFDEQVTDPLTRARLRRARGFCRGHTEIVVGMGDALGSSIIYADLLAEVRQALRGGTSEQCPACQSGTDAAKRALSTLLGHLDEEDVLAAYRNGDGVCLEHLSQLTTEKNRSAASVLVEIERDRLQRLAAECEEFVAKSDYRRQGEALGPERNAWQRAARKLGGGFPRNGA